MNIRFFGEVDGYRFALRCFYLILFFGDIFSDLIGIPRQDDFLGTGMWLFAAFFLSTLEWPTMALYVPFCALWWNKRPNSTDPRARPMKSWTVWGFVSILLLIGGGVLGIFYARNFGYSADGVLALFPKGKDDSRLFSYGFATLINVFEVAGLLVDRYWDEFDQFRDFLGGDSQQRASKSPTQKPDRGQQIRGYESERRPTPNVAKIVTKKIVNPVQCSANDGDIRCERIIPASDVQVRQFEAGNNKTLYYVPCAAHFETAKRASLEDLRKRRWVPREFAPNKED